MVNESGAAVSAGTVSVKGGATPVTINPDSMASYMDDTDLVGTLYTKGGQTLTFSASGGVVPMFSRTLTTPDYPVVSAPLLPSTDVPTYTLDRSVDLPIKWAPFTHGTFNFALSNTFTASDVNNSTSYSLTCNYDGTLGEATIPAAYLQMIPASTSASAATLDMSGNTSSTFQAGAYSVTLSLETFWSNSDNTTPNDQILLK